MNDINQKTKSVFNVERVTIGESSSWFSSLIFVLLFFVPVFSTILFGAVDNATWIFISILSLAISLLWLADAWKGGGLLFNQSSLQLPILALLLIGLIQLLPLSSANSDGLLSIGASNALSLNPYATRFFIFRLLVYAVFFAACLAFINNEGRLRKAFLVIIIFGAFMAFFGILQWLANPDGIYGLRDTPHAKPFGPFVNQHHFAAFMEMTAGVTIGLLVAKRTSKDKKILLMIAVVVMGVATLMTSSRGGVLSFVAVPAFVILVNFFSGRWSKEKRSASEDSGTQQKAVIAAVVAALVLVVFGLVLFLGGNEQLFRGIGVSSIQDGVSNGRAHFWPIALKIFFQHPILGAGFDAFGVAFTRYDTWNGFLRVEQAHNDYLQILAETGIAGFVCIGAFIFLLFRKGFKTISQTHGLRRDAALGSLAGCFGILVHSFFDFPLRTPSNAFFFLLLCAVATVPIAPSRTTTSRRRRSTTAPSL